MSEKVLVPDVGEADNIEVVELLVSVGDVVDKDDSLVVLESDKASMEIPSPFASFPTHEHCNGTVYCSVRPPGTGR